MSFHRTTLFVLAALFTAGMTSVASAGWRGWGVQAPVAYAPAGCGGCGTPSVAIVYAQPVAPPPVPVAVSTWSGGCGCGCGCRGLFSYTTPALEPTPIAPAPIYVVNQGPDYTGPGIMVPYRTWSPAASSIAPGAYPYVPGYGYGYGYGHRYGYGYHYGVHRAYLGPRRRVAYRERFYAHPSYRRPMPIGRPILHRYYR